jgi:hypothetical protein
MYFLHNRAPVLLQGPALSASKGLGAVQISLCALPAPGGGKHSKSVRDRSKDFFLRNQFSLAFDEKKSILRNKNEPEGDSLSPARSHENARRNKKGPQPFLFLTKSSIFDK